MYFVVTIDTEEDQWSDYDTKGQTLNNIAAIPRLQSIFEAYNVRPTYLISYPVANDKSSATYFNDLVSRDVAEVGAHCHPWNTPPFSEKICVKNSMLCNLPAELQSQKLATLTSLIEHKVGVKPISFRTGRWGYSAEVARSLLVLGYQVETSATPFMDWSQYQGPDLSASPLQPYFFEPVAPLVPNSKGPLLQVPVGIGFNRGNFGLAHKYSRLMSGNKVLRKLFVGSLSRLGLLQKIWLSPEISTATEMIKLIKVLNRKGVRCFNMMFHSNSLYPGNTPFVQDGDELEDFYSRIEQVLAFVRSLGCQCVTLAEIRSELEQSR